MHIVIDIRSLQPNSLPHRAVNESFQNWLTAFLKMPYKHRVTLLIDPRLDLPRLNMPLTGSFWQTIAFESHPELSPAPSREGEVLASHKTNQFLLEQKADLFHLTSPLGHTPLVGAPPMACRTVVTLHEASVLSTNNSSQAQEKSLAARVEAKIRSYGYCSRIVVDSQSVAALLVKLTNLPANRIEVMQNSLSPQEIALTIRQTYAKALASPIGFGQQKRDAPVRESLLDKLASKFSSLAAQAEVAERTYTVKSNLPLLGPHIATVRRLMTEHLREAYFDIMIDRQEEFNKKLVTSLQLVSKLLALHKEKLTLKSTQKEEQALHASQDIIDEAIKRAPTHEVMNPYLLAGPLAEYGECLGRAFYEILYSTSLISMDSASNQQKRTNRDFIVELHQLTHLAEEEVEQHDWRQKVITTRQELLNAYIQTLEADVILRDYKIQSHQKQIGWLIAWVRRHLTSHLHKPYIDPTLEKQVRFNHLVLKALSDIYSINDLLLEELASVGDITCDNYMVTSDKPLIGPLIVWLRQNLTSHLREPYIDLIFKRQADFNLLVLGILRALNLYVTTIHLKEYDHRFSSKRTIQQELLAIEQRLVSKTNPVGTPSTTQSAFQNQALHLVNVMNKRLEECL